MTPFKILVTNQKGGVGKSTISANLAAFFKLKNGIETAFIDFDRQGSSSNWLSKASNIGVTVHRANMQSQNNPGLVLLEAKATLRDCSKIAEIVIADLTWSHNLPPQFLLEFDMIVVPSSTSRVEMASSEIFVLEYLQRNLALVRKRNQIIVMAPSRIDPDQDISGIFPFVSANSNCLVSPPVQKIRDIDQYYCNHFLCEAEDESVAMNFCEFGSFVYEKYCALKTPTKISHCEVGNYGLSDSQNQIIRPNLAGVIRNSGSAPTTLKSERLGQKVVDHFIPRFLRVKNSIETNEGV